MLVDANYALRKSTKEYIILRIGEYQIHVPSVHSGSANYNVEHSPINIIPQ
jgi:hypothetical protein